MDATILVKFTTNHTHAGVAHIKGSTMEVSPAVFDRMNRLSAVETVEVAIAGTANIDMEAARAKAARAAQEAEENDGVYVLNGTRHQRKRRQ